MQFTYGPDYQRKISELKNNGNTERKVIYVGDYEKIIVGANTYEIKYIAGGDGLAAIAVKQNTGPEQIYYVHTDHLGSIINIYDASGNSVFAQSFDAWGRERDFADWTVPNTQTPPDWLIRGYTGHEHHREFGLINMNGRVYDPIVGRMLSPDNYVQLADFTQTFNRYTYGLNNPLKYTDPNGQFIPFLVVVGAFALAGTYTGAAIQQKEIWAGNWNWHDKDMYKAMGIGAIAGAGVGLGFSAAFGSTLGIGGMSSGIAGFSSYGGTTATWNIASNALITANINMASSWAQGRDMNEILLSGGSGLVAGAVGGYIGGNFYNSEAGGLKGVFNQSAIRATNYYTATINGGLDRFTNSVYHKESAGQVITNTLLGAGEGLYSAYLGNKNGITSLGPHGVVGRYLSGALSEGITSVPGLGVSIASYQATGLGYRDMFTSESVLSWDLGLLPPPSGFLFAGWLINNKVYTSSVIDPFLTGGYKH